MRTLGVAMSTSHTRTAYSDTVMRFRWSACPAAFPISQTSFSRACKSMSAGEFMPGTTNLKDSVTVLCRVALEDAEGDQQCNQDQKNRVDRAPLNTWGIKLCNVAVNSSPIQECCRWDGEQVPPAAGHVPFLSLAQHPITSTW